jgi:CPA2 family monovalent cation:H+ antiporter-2
MPDLVLSLSPELQFIADLGIAVAAALAGGVVAVRLRQPPLVGYLAAGVVIGPFTPGSIGDPARISELADLGVVLLLFALGVDFPLRELARTRRIVLPGTLAQVLVTAAAAMAASLALGLGATEAVVVGAAIAISSTLVVLKVLGERGELDSLHGRVAIGWMVVQDVVTVVLIAMLDPLAGTDATAPVLLAIARTVAFLALAYLVGSRLLPWLLRAVSRLRSPELFMLTVFATAIVAAFLSSALFGLSLALGAFIAGIIVAESEVAHQAASEIIPFRDLFAVLFFVSVGMLLDPAAIAADWAALVALLLVAMLVKASVGAGLARLLGLPRRSAILLGATIGQAGEFSFLLADRALSLDLLDARAYNLVLATTAISIVLTPAVTRAAHRLVAVLERREPVPEPPQPGVEPETRGELAMADDEDAARLSIVVLGAGRVGMVVVRAVRARGFRCVVVDRDQIALDGAAAQGGATLYGDAASPAILRRAGLDRARLLVVAIGDPLASRLAVERARAINPRLPIVARARGSTEIQSLRELKVTRLADPEVEAALELARAALARMGVSGPEQAAITLSLRRRAYGDLSGPPPGRRRQTTPDSADR